nr:glycine dehydrogenase [Alphaproteobacteria bacterium]
MTQQRPSLVELEDTGAFARRHIGPGAGEQAEMLAALGLPSLDALIERTMPATIATDSGLDTGDGCDEAEVLAELRGLAAKNRVVKSFIGLGYYGTHTPAVVLRNVLENPSWYTSYTPYQAEVAQGRLEALLNFQTMVADLTAMDIANASLLDEPTAAAEAMAMSHRLTREKTHRYFVDADTHPQTLAVIRTRAEPLGIEVVTGDPEQLDTDGLFGALFCYPGSSGRIRNFTDAIERVRAAGGIVTMSTDLLALTLLLPPGELGADIVVGSAQRFGVPFGFGGPHAGFMATHEPHKRAMPGRLVGVSIDPKGRPGLRLALQTREQHIRREKATSNVCTAQALLAIMAGFYAAYHGPEGLTRIAQRTHRLTGMLAAGLRQAGFELTGDRFFDTLTIAAPGKADTLVQAALEAGYNLRRVDADHLGISLDETATRDDVAALLVA